jgi:predicted secreted protein
MTTEADLGYGLIYEIYYSGIYTAVSEAFDIQPGEETADRVDATHYQSPGRRRERIAGLIDVGTGTVQFNFKPNNSTHQMLRALKASGDAVNHRITYPDGETCVFAAIVTGISQALPIDDRMTASFTFEVSGDETWTS